MNNKFFFYSFLLLFSFFLFGKENQVKISANYTNYKTKDKQIFFSGSVDLREKDFHLKSDRLWGHFDENSGLEKIICYGKVSIKKQALKGSCNKLTYLVKEGKIIMQENAELIQEDTEDGIFFEYQAKEIIFYRNTDKIIIKKATIQGK